MTDKPRVLVTFASKHGATQEIAEDIGSTLRTAGLAVDVRPVTLIGDITPYTGVVIGSGLYAGRWARDARRFVVRFADQLRQRPVWMFSIGSHTTSDDESTLVPTRSVSTLMARVGARGHARFGGKAVTSKLASKLAGDWRNWEQIRRWANQVATEIATAPDVPPRTMPSMRSGGGVLATLCLLVGVAAITGGASLLIWPDGSALHLSTELLRYSPFHDFLIPGLLLTLVGLGHLIAGGLVINETPHANDIAFFAGGALLVWIVVQMVLLQTTHWLQLGMLVTAFAIIAQALLRHASFATVRPS